MLIYFLQPDVDYPSGGLQQAYAMVEVLTELGYSAAVYHGKPGFRCKWFDSTAPVVSTPRLDLELGDILVAPEYASNEFQWCTEGANVVMLNQNFINTFRGAGLVDKWSGGYPGWPNVVAVLATSRECSRFVRASLREPMPVFVARCLVDTDLFAPRDKTPTITFMPRRRYRDVEAVVQILLRRPSLKQWDLLPLHGLAQTEVAAALGRSSMFLSFADREGFGLPSAEAMAAGCYVIGFTGLGGREFMSTETCSIMDGMDLVAFADEVERSAQRWMDGDPTYTEAVRLARSTIEGTYNRSGLAADLQNAFTELTSVGSAAPQTKPTTVRHFSTATLRQRVREGVRPLVPKRMRAALVRHSDDLPPANG